MRRLLLVEDDDGQAIAMAQRLRAANYKVLVTFDVDTATRLLDDHDFDLILCDLFLPPESGLDVLDAVCRRNLATPFLLMSGRRPDEYDWMLRKYPRIAAFIPKPCVFDDLLRVLEQFSSGMST